MEKSNPTKACFKDFLEMHAIGYSGADLFDFSLKRANIFTTADPVEF